MKNATAKSETDIYDMVACQVRCACTMCSPVIDIQHVQADKRVVCEPSSNATTESNPCTTEAGFIPRAVCSFSAELWKLGATCVANHVNGGKHPQCADDASLGAISSILTLCRNATHADAHSCSRLAMTF